MPIRHCPNCTVTEGLREVGTVVEGGEGSRRNLHLGSMPPPISVDIRWGIVLAILFLAIGLAVGGLVVYLHRRRRATAELTRTKQALAASHAAAERAEAAQAAEQQAQAAASRAVEREEQAR